MAAECSGRPLLHHLRRSGRGDSDKRLPSETRPQRGGPAAQCSSAPSLSPGREQWWLDILPPLPRPPHHHRVPSVEQSLNTTLAGSVVVRQAAERIFSPQCQRAELATPYALEKRETAARYKSLATQAVACDPRAPRSGMQLQTTTQSTRALMEVGAHVEAAVLTNLRTMREHLARLDGGLQ